MANPTVKDNNFITIQGFMVNDLGLKGNELLVYAIIFGMSQDDESEYYGSLQYLADWTSSTKQGILKNLKSLMEKNLITKSEETRNGIKIVEYHATKFNGIKQSLTGGIKLSLPNNKDIYNNNMYNNNNIYKDIIEYLNSKTGKNYRSNIPKTESLIKARLKEGYSVDDFKKVIDIKVAEWKGTDMEKFLRPETLFSNKFEGYLNQTPSGGSNNSKYCEEPEFDFSFMKG